MKVYLIEIGPFSWHVASETLHEAVLEAETKLQHRLMDEQGTQEVEAMQAAMKDVKSAKLVCTLL